MFQIGIIDDAPSERDDIQVSIMDNVEHPEDVVFKNYEIERREKGEILVEIRQDIIEDQINGLIVDFKLDTAEDVITGAEIIEFMHKETPEFPVVIMTNAPEDSKESDVTDADKVYAKKVFLDPEKPETKEMVYNLMLCMRKYVNSRHKLEGMLDEEVSRLAEDSENEVVLKRIIDLEEDLSKYKQIYRTSYSSRIDVGELKEAASLLESIKRSLGE